MNKDYIEIFYKIYDFLRSFLFVIICNLLYCYFIVSSSFLLYSYAFSVLFFIYNRKILKSIYMCYVFENEHLDIKNFHIYISYLTIVIFSSIIDFFCILLSPFLLPLIIFTFIFTFIFAFIFILLDLFFPPEKNEHLNSTTEFSEEYTENNIENIENSNYNEEIFSNYVFIPKENNILENYESDFSIPFFETYNNYELIFGFIIPDLIEIVELKHIILILFSPLFFIFLLMSFIMISYGFYFSFHLVLLAIKTVFNSLIIFI